MTGHSENLDRAQWQSARTKDGKIAELPMPYSQAWDEAHAEDEAREQAEAGEHGPLCECPACDDAKIGDGAEGA